MIELYFATVLITAITYFYFMYKTENDQDVMDKVLLIVSVPSESKYKYPEMFVFIPGFNIFIAACLLWVIKTSYENLESLVHKSYKHENDEDL